MPTSANQATAFPLSTSRLMRPRVRARLPGSSPCPRPPSTRMRWPSLIRCVAVPVPTTAGRPYSRATIAMWLIDPPMSRDRGADLLEDRRPGRVGDLADEDIALLQPADLLDRLDHPRRCLRPRRDEAAKPLSSFGSGSSPALSQVSRLSRVMPHSITIAGSSITSGTAPSAGEVACLPHSSIAAARCLTIAGQCCGPRGGEPMPQLEHQIDDRAFELVVGEVEHVLLLLRRSRARRSSAPNSRILLKNRLVYQCSQ